jgi:hypothetical protein
MESNPSMDRVMEDAWTNHTSMVLGETADPVVKINFLAHKAVSLRGLLILVGCLFVLASGLIVFGICFGAGLSSVDFVVDDLETSISDAIVRELNNWFTSAYHGVNEYAEQLRISALYGLLNLTEQSVIDMRRINLPVVRQFVPSLYMGFKTVKQAKKSKRKKNVSKPKKKGYFVGYNNLGSADGSFVLTQSLSGVAVRSRYLTDALGFPTMLMPNTTRVYNSTLRPWYIMGATTQLPSFTSVYSFVNIRLLSFNLALEFAICSCVLIVVVCVCIFVCAFVCVCSCIFVVVVCVCFAFLFALMFCVLCFVFCILCLSQIKP